ncbi:UvrD/REP helicase [Stanieria cyanosphaera PCC 7437]|uniref:DNA 3'-5' helicase n=1 Tax=Stanieria cyanosphaera (strain ATCC 29371 / PCC 7437) TaxID=111780 RepID=K9XSA9_STAC7|nr:ATP-dependent helicase [Stanieria cyanosphaera]AFZ34969.1 UvrD/REP helicase [Stanieria cyanosphaera PCC 7437]
MSLDSDRLASTVANLPSTDLEHSAWLKLKLQQLRNSLRPGQENLANWNGGLMAVSAVPGAGKSHSLAVAAAIAIAKHQLHSRKQLVIVTYTRSAAASIKTKIRNLLKELYLPPGGFIVQTLHGLALNIANSQRELSGLNLDRVTIVVPTVGHRVIKGAVDKWIAENPRRYAMLIEGIQFDGEETERLRRQSVLRTEILPNLAYTVVREAKSSGLLPEDLQKFSQLTTDEYGILEIAAGLYQQYQQLMRSRNLIDYDDMILAALRVLKYEPMRQLWQNQVFAVFEDEAQDSSPLQAQLISILAENDLDPDLPANLVRVGDPNQAINSTFTPADPIYFNWFCRHCEQQGNFATMNQAGRSSEIIIKAANFALQWMNRQENKQNNLDLPFRLQNIATVSQNDPQPEANPEPEGKGLEIYQPDDIYHTVTLIGERVKKLLEGNQERNAAILVRENRQGRFLAEQLAYLQREHQIRVYEVGEVDRHCQIPEEILKLLQFIYRPHSPDNLKAALEVIEQRGLIATQDLNALATFPEQFLYPTPLQPQAKPHIEQVRRYCCNILRARIELPHYQLIPFLGMTLKYTGSELATVQKLSERVNQQITGHSSLPNTIRALEEIVSSEKFEAVEEDHDDQYTRSGQLTIITMHKAKGLDWDYVFIPFLHEDILPGQPWIPTSGRFLGNYTLAEVARAQIRAIVHNQYQGEIESLLIPQPLEAWREAGKLKQAEEFRLLYVAMTRAKRLLWMSAAAIGPFRWNTFRGDKPTNLQTKKPCPILPTLARQFPESVMK